MWKLPPRKQNNILLHILDLGERKISIPVVQIGSGEGENILITAGMDGDEYAGIEAAYSLIDYYSKTKFAGKLIIIPIVNIPGFENAVSWNPLDNKYPKHVFPGKEKGSATEKLMYWLSNNFVKDVDIWIDLHSGASTEVLQSYVGAYMSRHKKVQERLITCLSKVKAERINFDKNPTVFSENIAKRNIARIILESGQLGERNKKDVKQHIEWVKQLLLKEYKKPSKKMVYEYVDEQIAQKEGIWVPLFLGKVVKKGMTLGEVRSLDGKILQKLSAKERGVLLWRREAMFCKKRDSLYAYAYGKVGL